MWRAEDKGQGTGTRDKAQGTRHKGKAPDDLGNADEKMKLKISRREVKEAWGKSIKNCNAGILKPWRRRCIHRDQSMKLLNSGIGHGSMLKRSSANVTNR